MTSNSSDLELDLPPETPEEVYAALLRALRRKRGFGLFFVECSPQKGNELITSLQTDLPSKKYRVLSLDRSSNTLYDRVSELWQQEPFDVLFVQGLENALYEYEDTKRLAGWTSKEIYSYSWKGVPRILSHLNQQRERFRDNFNSCFVFLVPPFVIKYFIRRAPDFFDWRSGLFTFPDLPENTEQIANRILGSRDYEEYLQLTLEQRNEKLLNLTDALNHSQLLSHGYADLWREKGRLFHAAGDYKAALYCYNKAIEFKPDSHEAWNNRGNVLADLGDKEEAIFSYDKAVECRPDYYIGWLNRGNTFSYLGRKEEAISSYDKAIAYKPDYYIAWFNRGIALSDLGRKEEAISSYDKAIAYKPDYYIAWFNRGLMLSGLGCKAEAVFSYDKALEHRPDHHEAWFSRGVALSSLGRKAEAVFSYDKALQLKPDDHEAWFNRGVVLLGLGHREAAISSYDETLQLKPGDYEAWFNRGIALSALGYKAEAIASYDKAIECKPDYYEAWNNRALSFQLQVASEKQSTATTGPLNASLTIT